MSKKTEKLISRTLLKSNKPTASIEIKFSNSPKPSKGFFRGINYLETAKNFITTPSSDSFPLGNAMVYSLNDFIEEVLPEL